MIIKANAIFHDVCEPFEILTVMKADQQLWQMHYNWCLNAVGGPFVFEKHMRKP